MKSNYYSIQNENNIIGPIWYDIYSNPNKKREQIEIYEPSAQQENSFNIDSIIKNDKKEFINTSNENPTNVVNPTNVGKIEAPILKNSEDFIKSDFQITDVRLEKDDHLHSKTKKYILYFILIVLIILMLT